MFTALILAAIDFRDPIWQFWVGVASLGLSTLAIVITIVVAVRSRRRKVLTYEVVSNSSIINTDNDVGEDLELLLEGHPVHHVRLHVIKLLNAGNTTISPEDYPNQLGFEFFSASYPHPLVLCSIHRTEPENLLPRNLRKSLLAIDASERSLMILKPPLLNPRDALFLKVLLMAKDRKSTTMQVIGQVKEGVIKSYTTPSPRIAQRVVMAGIAVAFVLGLLFSNSFSLLTAFAGGNCALGSIQVGGSTSFYSTALAEAQRYKATCPIASISVNQSSSLTGLQDLASGSLQIADSEVAASSTVRVQDHKVAAIIFTLIVNKQVGLSNLSLQQVQEIYSGKFKYWSDIPHISSSAPHIPIQIFGRASSSGTHAAFERYVLQGHTDQTPSQNILDRSLEVVSTVANTPGAIGYTDYGDAQNGTVTSLELDQYAPSASLVEQGFYPFWAIEHMYTNQTPDALSASFIDHVKQDLQSKESFAKGTFVSLSNISSQALDGHS